MEKELNLVSKLIDAHHFTIYYQPENDLDTMYMNYVPELLKEYIYKKEMPLDQKIDFAKQLVKAVMVLHQSGIVHRDLKP